MSLYTQSVGRTSCWLNDWLKVDESQKKELWIKSVLAKENCELAYNEILCANAKKCLSILHSSQDWHPNGTPHFKKMWAIVWIPTFTLT